MKLKPWIMLIMMAIICPRAYCENKFVPDAPISDFMLPMFGEEGFKIWDLRGRKGLFVGEDEVKVQGMALRTFSGDEAAELETTIESIEANICLKENKAYGDDLIVLKGPKYSVVGTGWFWDGSAKRVIVKENVKVTFEESIDEAVL